MGNGSKNSIRSEVLNFFDFFLNLWVSKPNFVDSEYEKNCAQALPVPIYQFTNLASHS